MASARAGEDAPQPDGKAASPPQPEADDAASPPEASDAASPPPPDDEAGDAAPPAEAGDAAPPAADPDAARVHPSMSSLFDAERGHGAMIAMEGGVLDPTTTTGGSAAAAEYAPGDAVVHDGETLFIVEDVLGEGAFGAVYKVRPAVGGGRALAVKSVKPSLPAEKKAKMHVQLAAEAAICFAIGRHAHLVSVHRVLPTPKGLLIVMDLVYGTDLREHAGKTFKGVLYLGGRAEANKRVDYLVAQLYKGLAHLHGRAVLHMDLKPDNLMVGAGDRLLITDYGLAGECDRRDFDPWTKKKLERGTLICAPFKGGTANYMSEEQAGLRRALAAATTDEEYRRIKEDKLVTAATTDIVAAALVTFELYAQTNRWPLIMLTAAEAAGVDARGAREMLGNLGARLSLAEVEAWGAEELAAWLGREKMLSRFQPMALDGSITIGALLDAVVLT